MPIWMVGIDHHDTSLDVRSVFSFPSNQVKQIFETLKERSDVSGSVLISTCNRMELWLSVSEDASFSVREVICDFAQVSTEDYASYFHEKKDKEAVDHLFRLAAGLESQIVGEGQILTQIGDALALARSLYATDNIMEVLFRQAVTAGKRVRTETDLSTADQSIIHTALKMLNDEGFSVSGRKCMVIGNGMMGRLSAQTLLDQKADVTVTIRRYHSGVVDVPFDCKRISYDDRYELLPSCDVVVSATSSPNYTIREELLSAIKIDHPIYFLDLAVPRDIEASVSDLPFVKLYDMDSFHIDIRTEKFNRNLIKAEKILQEEKDNFAEWFEGRDIIPLIQKVKQQAGQDVAKRMTPMWKTADVSESERMHIESEVQGASARMMNYLLHSMRTRMPAVMFRNVLDEMDRILEEG